MPRKKTYEEVKRAFKDEGYRLLSKEYKNNKEILIILCPNGHEHELTFHGFQHGRNMYLPVKSWTLCVQMVTESNKHGLIFI
jgi:hypothetical protein